MAAPRPVAVLGGTFDPVHIGHLVVAEQVRDAIGASEAWLLPTNVPPHRPPADAPAGDRIALLEAAVRGRPGLRVVDLEARRPGVSYTADTVDDLARLHPELVAWLVLGADAAREIRAWHRRDRVLARAHMVLVNRSGVPPIDRAEASGLGFDPRRTRIIDVASPPVSATEVRERLARGGPLDDLLPPAVSRLISERGLYRRPATGARP